VIIVGEHEVDLAATLDALAARGFGSILAEGGSSLNGQLAAAGLLDELCLTLRCYWPGRRQADPGWARSGNRAGVAAALALRAGRVLVPPVPPK
jgi:riboflavin biosynthesis pyrimidine reductase